MQPLPEPTKIYSTRTVALFLVVCLSLGPMFVPVFSRLFADEAVPISDNDFDGDQIVNTADIDDDNDGIIDLLEISETGNDIDSDRDGQPDRLDLDSDNDGILDWQESGALIQLDLSGVRRVGPRLVGETGTNGLIDVFESSANDGTMRYTLSNIDSSQDDIPDFLDLDSDNDGWPDLREAGVLASYDSNNDGRLDLLNSSVGDDGIADYLQKIPDQSCCDLDGDGDQETGPANTDMIDLPDFQDLDSDNDGIFDLVELNGQDADNNGRVDSFLDVTGGVNGPDGMDDGLAAFPLRPQDENANGVEDHIEFVASTPETGPDSADIDPGQDMPGQQPVPSEPVPAAQDEPPLADEIVDGAVRTGLNSAGCSIYSQGPNRLFVLMILLSAGVLVIRSNVRRRNAN